MSQTNLSYRQYLQNNAQTIMKQNSLSAMIFAGVTSYYTNIVHESGSNINIYENDLKNSYLKKQSNRVKFAPKVELTKQK